MLSRGGYLRNFWVVMCRWDPGTLSLYQSSFKWIFLPYTRLNYQNPPPPPIPEYLLSRNYRGHKKSSWNKTQGLQILLISGVSLTPASQNLESFWNIWSQVSDFPARGPGMYTLSWGIHEVAVVVGWPGKLKSMIVVIE